MTMKPDHSKHLDLDSEVVREAQHWIQKNQGVSLGSGRYGSPRVSSELADCSMPLTFDQYNFCSLGCMYCFAYFFKTNNPAFDGSSLTSIKPDRMIATMQGKHPNDKLWRHFYSKEFLLHWGGLADPFCNFERRNGIGQKVIDALAEMNYPCLFSFKGSTIRSKPLMNVFEKASHQHNFAFQISIVTNSDEMSKRIEIGVVPTSARLATMKILSDMGYWTILRLRPFIMGISDEGLEELLGRALEAGVRAVSVEWFALDLRMNEGMRKRYDWISSLIGTDIIPYYKRLSPAHRGGYLRLNRLVKEPYIKIIYDFCAKHNLVCGISDPDFKELNTSGSCCGMPDNYPDNKKLQNWSTNQMTYHLKEARRLYHTTGKIKLLKFKEVYGEDTSYLTDRATAQDHPCVVGMPNAERQLITLRDVLQRQWNRLGSPSNPRNYFHGKVEPIHTLDDEGNYIYKYVPMEYERAWNEQGIDLKR